MPFENFLGNPGAAAQVRAAVRDRAGNPTWLLSGPAGVGKTTLALRLGLGLNCQKPAPEGEFCGECASCQSFRGFDCLPELIEAGLEYRQAAARTRARELAPLMVEAHPQIRFFPPDGEMLTMAQAREAARMAQMRPDPGRHWVLILEGFDRARWMVQSAMLKVLEEPPAGCTLVLLAAHAREVLATVRSRARVVELGPVDSGELDTWLAGQRPQMKHAELELIARLAGGCPGRARELDLAAYRQKREFFMACLEALARPGGHMRLFGLTEGMRNQKEGVETQAEILYSLLQDVVYLKSGHSLAIRNLDARGRLEGWAQQIGWNQLTQAVEQLDRLVGLSRRNLNRALAWDAWTLRLRARA